MILEINLVKTSSIDSTYAQLLLRKRVTVESDTEALDNILKMLHDNFEFVEGAINDKLLATKISNLDSMTINELYELKYYLNYYGGLDIWFWYVSEMELGAEGIESGNLEYTIVDRTCMQSLFIPLAQRFNWESDSIKLSAIFNKALELSGLFNGNFSEGAINPIKNQIDAIVPNEQSLGMVSDLITYNINSIFKYMGRTLMTISE